ncbi:MAG: hypothetical protein ACXWJX_11165, partial [Limisphaerales bacterium]
PLFNHTRRRLNAAFRRAAKNIVGMFLLLSKAEAERRPRITQCGLKISRESRTLPHIPAHCLTFRGD